MGTPVKFTVIIPTRERADVLYYSLRTAVAQDYEDLTILVSDNFSQDNTKQVVDSFHDPRINYVNTGKSVSLVHNWEFALAHVKDGWVTIIGDDDGLLPGALTTVVEVIRKTGCQAIMSNSCHYTWPGEGQKGNTLKIPLDKGIEWRNTRAWLGKVMNGEVDCKELPHLYTGGFIDSRIIDKARNADGVFYLSVGTDVYSMIAFASVMDDFVMLKEPVAIEGVSSHSGTMAFYGDVKKREHLKRQSSLGPIPFDHRLVESSDDMHQFGPKSASIGLYEAYLQAEHLHHNSLNIKMEDQLALALVKARPDDYESIRKYCVKIADRNGIDMAVIDREEKALRKLNQRGGRLKYWKYRIDSSFNYLFLSGKEFGIKDIYGASILVKDVWPFETRFARRLGRVLRGGCRHIINKIFFVLKKLGALLLAFPFVIVMRLIRPFIFVRFSRMHSMIGSCASGMEIYLCEKDLGMHEWIFDIYYISSRIANRHLVKMWCRVVPMLPQGLVSAILWINRRIPGGKDDMVNGNLTSFEFDVDCVLSKTKPHLSFTKAEERHGQEALRKMGIPPGAPFVCFHTRDESYIQKVLLQNDDHYSLFRNSNIENYGLAVKELVGRGYHCIRMGSVVQSKISFSSSNVIDYATNGMRSEFLDIYLAAKCQFFLGTTSGITYIPMIFRRPLAVVNSFPMGHAISWGKGDVLCFKKLWLVKEKRFLRFREILHSELAVLYTPQRYREMGIEVVENTPEEICDVTQEMVARIDGSWETTEEYEDLQRRFWALYEYAPLRELVDKEIGMLGENARKDRPVRPFQALARVGSKFLLQNRGLLD